MKSTIPPSKYHRGEVKVIDLADPRQRHRLKRNRDAPLDEWFAELERIKREAAEV